MLTNVIRPFRLLRYVLFTSFIVRPSRTFVSWYRGTQITSCFLLHLTERDTVFCLYYTVTEQHEIIVAEVALPIQLDKTRQRRNPTKWHCIAYSCIRKLLGPNLQCSAHLWRSYPSCVEDVARVAFLFFLLCCAVFSILSCWKLTWTFITCMKAPACWPTIIDRLSSIQCRSLVKSGKNCYYLLYNEMWSNVEM